MAQVPVTRCQYCGSQDIGEGWQHSVALVTFKYHGLLGNRLEVPDLPPLRSVLYQCVAEPHRFPTSKKITLECRRRECDEEST